MSDELQKRICRTAGPSVKVVPDTGFTEKAVVQCDVSVVKILDGDMQIITNKFWRGILSVLFLELVFSTGLVSWKIEENFVQSLLFVPEYYFP